MGGASVSYISLVTVSLQPGSAEWADSLPRLLFLSHQEEVNRLRSSGDTGGGL